jgi:RNA polymerase sigma-70 factor (ECF subfamily)
MGLEPTGNATDPRRFRSTRWSLVQQAAHGADEDRAAALSDLCTAYWYPLYAFVRRRGHSPDEARDLTQAFFARVLERRGLAGADPERGRFRSYLLGAMKHFLANEWHRARAGKRGGDSVLLDLDALDPEARYALQPAPSADPDLEFDREWARQTTARALERLREESEARGKGRLFEVLEGTLTGEERDRREAASRLDMTEGAVKVAVHRLRRRYRELLRAEIAETVGDPAQVEVEMRHLVAVLRGA